MKISRRRLLAGASFLGSTALLDSPRLLAFAKASGQPGARAGSADAFALPKPDLAGPVQPNWESFRDHYKDLECPA